MDVSKEFIRLTGSKIRFRTYNGEFEGVVKNVYLETQRVTMQSVYDLLQNVFIGDKTVFFHHFLTYSVISKFRNHEIRKSELPSHSKVNFSKNDCNTAVSSKETSSRLISDQSVADKDLNLSEFVLKLPPNLQHSLPGDYVILDSIDLEFKSATNHISRQSVVGVSFQGYEISSIRIGKLFWICIVTEYCVFIFDIQALGRSAFDCALRNIFESQNIVKVIHDCRRPSDCLYYIFSTTLVNIFDIQVADFVSKHKFGNKYNFANGISLDKYLKDNLAIPEEFLYASKKVLERNYFSKRPLDDECLNILIKDTVYLLMLKENLTKRMLNSAYKASDFYLKVIAESSKLFPKPSFPSEIPSALLKQGLEIVALRKDYLKPSVTTTASDLNHSSKKKVSRELELSEKGTCKNMASNDKQSRKSKHSVNICISATPETLANDFQQKCSVVRKEFLSNKIHDSEKGRNPASKIIAPKKVEDEAVKPLDQFVSKTDFPNATLKKNSTNKLLLAVTGTETNAYSKLGIQTKSRDTNDNTCNNTNYSISDYSDFWESLRSSCGTSNFTNTFERKSTNIKFIPSGMNC